MARPHNLALSYQEVLTVIVRLRSNRQPVKNAEAFRGQIRAALQVAEQEALRNGYSSDDVRLVAFAVVAFLDESILNSQNPVFAEWLRKPLQDEMFGVHIAGQVFFGNVDRLLARQNSVHLADVLELYELCLLLGYRGRYSAGGGADVRSLSASIRAKIRQIRGAPAVLPWAPPAGESPSAPPDLWGRRLVWGAVASCLLALILFAGFQFSLHGQLSEVHAAVRQGSGGRP